MDLQRLHTQTETRKQHIHTICTILHYTRSKKRSKAEDIIVRLKAQINELNLPHLPTEPFDQGK